MHKTNQNKYTVPKLGRIQVALSSGYDPAFVAEALRQTSIRAEIVGFSEGGCVLLVTSPKGITINVLEGSESHHGYYANIDDAVYSKLFVARQKGRGVVLKGESTSLEDDLLLTRKYPLIIEPRLNDWRDKSRLELMVGCYRSIKILRSEQVIPNSAHDPFSMPEGMRELLTILEEPIPSAAERQEFLIQRVKNIRDLFEWYAKKVLADEVQEELRVAITRLTDFMLRIGERQLGKQVVTNTSGFSNVEGDFLEQFESQTGYEQMHAALTDDVFDGIPVHECSCGGDAEVVERTINQKGEEKTLSLVKCKACSKKQDRNDWGIECQAVAAWNKKNGEYHCDNYPVQFELDGLKQDELHKQLKAFNKLTIDIMAGYKKLPTIAKDNLSALYERLLEVQAWSSYIRNAEKARR